MKNTAAPEVISDKAEYQATVEGVEVSLMQIEQIRGVIPLQIHTERRPELLLRSMSLNLQDPEGP